MQSSAVNAAATVCLEPLYEPWTNVSSEGHTAVVCDLKKVSDVVLVRQKNARDTSERRFGCSECPVF